MQSERSGCRREGRMENAAMHLLCAEVYSRAGCCHAAVCLHILLVLVLSSCAAEACDVVLWHLLSALSLSALRLIRRVSLSFCLRNESSHTFKSTFTAHTPTQTQDIHASEKLSLSSVRSNKGRACLGICILNDA